MAKSKQQTESTSNSTLTFKTPGGHEIVIKGFVSGGDMEDLQRVFLENMTYKIDPVTQEADTTSVQELNATISLDRKKKALELLVISVDGETDDVYNKVRDLPVADYDVIVEKVNKVSGPLAKAPSKS